ncbi:MAG TPA: hypothetical protein VGG28_05605, partial [Kofleriaceae bacterium]
MRVALAMVALAACKSSGGTTVDAPPAATFTFDFNGTPYSGSLIAKATLEPSGPGGNTLAIEASDSLTHMIEIVPATTQTMIAIDSYDIGATAPYAAIEFNDGSAGTWSAGGNTSLVGSGDVTITWMIATEIKGTFESTLTGSGSGT